MGRRRDAGGGGGERRNGSHPKASGGGGGVAVQRGPTRGAKAVPDGRGAGKLNERPPPPPRTGPKPIALPATFI